MAKATFTQTFADEHPRGRLVLPWDYVVMKPSFLGQLARRVARDLPPGGTVLDINPGTCALKARLPEGTIYLGLEQSSSLRESIAGKGVKVQDWDLPFIPHEDETVDRIVCGAFLEHLPTYRDALDFLLEVRRVLKPGGRAHLIFPEFRQLGDAFFDDYKHTWPTSHDRVSGMARDCGLKVTGRVHTIGWITLCTNPVTWLCAALVGLGFSIVNLRLVDRMIRGLGLWPLAYKIKKTVFELTLLTVERPPA